MESMNSRLSRFTPVAGLLLTLSAGPLLTGCGLGSGFGSPDPPVNPTPPANQTRLVFDGPNIAMFDQNRGDNPIPRLACLYNYQGNDYAFFDVGINSSPGLRQMVMRKTGTTDDINIFFGQVSYDYLDPNYGKDIAPGRVSEIKTQNDGYMLFDHRIAGQIWVLMYDNAHTLQGVSMGKPNPDGKSYTLTPSTPDAYQNGLNSRHAKLAPMAEVKRSGRHTRDAADINFERPDYTGTQGSGDQAYGGGPTVEEYCHSMLRGISNRLDFFSDAADGFAYNDIWMSTQRDLTVQLTALFGQNTVTTYAQGRQLMAA
jgi:hypothetical protein